MVIDQLRDDPSAHAKSLPGSQHNLEDTDETSEDSRYHSDQGSGAQVRMLLMQSLCSGLWLSYSYLSRS